MMYYPALVKFVLMQTSQDDTFPIWQRIVPIEFYTEFTVISVVLYLTAMEDSNTGFYLLTAALDSSGFTFCEINQMLLRHLRSSKSLLRIILMLPYPYYMLTMLLDSLKVC
jgi:hypothetical protein